MTQNWGYPCPVGSHGHLVEQKTAVHRGDRATQVSALLKSDLFGMRSSFSNSRKGGFVKEGYFDMEPSRVSGNSISIGVFS